MDRQRFTGLKKLRAEHEYVVGEYHSIETENGKLRETYRQMKEYVDKVNKKLVGAAESQDLATISQ